MSLTFNTYVTQITNLLVTSTADSNFNTMLPGMIDYAEQRMYRELDLLATRVTDTSASLTPNVRTFSLPTSIGLFLVVEDISVLTPSTASFATGTRVQLVPISKQYINNVYPSASNNTGTPEYFAMIDDQTILLGPSPDLPYPVEVMGTQRPTPLSSSNQTTFLSQNLPDVFIAASMVYGSGWQRDFGAQSDDPSKAQSWEQTYKTLFTSADVEEFRKKYQSQGWTSNQPSPVATPARV